MTGRSEFFSLMVVVGVGMYALVSEESEGKEEEEEEGKRSIPFVSKQFLQISRLHSINKTSYFTHASIDA
jgi:hypothetical protein